FIVANPIERCQEPRRLFVMRVGTRHACAEMRAGSWISCCAAHGARRVTCGRLLRRLPKIPRHSPFAAIISTTFSSATAETRGGWASAHAGAGVSGAWGIDGTLGHAVTAAVSSQRPSGFLIPVARRFGGAF